jgi:hypothetical protein
MQLVKPEQLPLNEIMSIGKAFAESGMFADTKSAAQAIVKIQAGQEIGIPPFASMTGIHIIQGKPAIGAGLMAARVKGSGKYDYEVKQQTEKICSIDFFQGKKMIGNSTFTAEDAKKAGTKNMDKYPKNMLFARAMSNGIKWFTPDVFAGPVYTPEELGSPIVTEDTTAEVTTVKTGGEAPNHNDKELSEWQLPPETATEIGSLIETSTLDVNGKIVAANALLNAKSQGEVDKIKTRLLKLQTA